MAASAEPWVEIMEQPMGKGLRFRYISEGRTAGSIQGERSSPENRTFPSIKIHNYSGPATAVVSCVTADRPHRPHPHHLVGTSCTKGICTVQITSSIDPIPFSNIGIQCCTRKDISRNLEERRLLRVDPFQTGRDSNVDNIDLTMISLCFQVYLNVDGNFIPLNPVVSNPIVDKKVCSELSVCRLSRISGSVRGGDEVFLLCSKIRKEDIKVVFSQQLESGEVWEKNGIFSSTDVHKQYVVVFKTPPYAEVDIRQPVEVSLYLSRPSDGAVGEAKTFTYYPENPDPFGIKAKRRRLAADHGFQDDVKPSIDQSGGLASIVSSQMGLQASAWASTSLHDKRNQWKFPDPFLTINCQQPGVKAEFPGFGTGAPRPGPKNPGPLPYSIPTTVEDATAPAAGSRMAPSSSFTSFSSYSHPTYSKSSSALEALVMNDQVPRSSTSNSQPLSNSQPSTRTYSQTQNPRSSVLPPNAAASAAMSSSSQTVADTWDTMLTNATDGPLFSNVATAFFDDLLQQMTPLDLQNLGDTEFLNSAETLDLLRDIGDISYP